MDANDSHLNLPERIHGKQIIDLSVAESLIKRYGGMEFTFSDLDGFQIEGHNPLLDLEYIDYSKMGMGEIYKKSSTPEFGKALMGNIMQYFEPNTCEICGKAVKETYTCRDCEQEFCDNCKSEYNQFTQIDYNCCSNCGKSKVER